VRASRRRVDRIVVVDNGSAPTFVAPPDVVNVRSERNLGFSGGCNLGLRYVAAAERILILNSDVELAPDCIEKLEAALVDGVGIVGPAVLDMSPQRRVESLGVRVSQRTGRMRNLVRPGAVDAVVGACMLVRREVFERAGHFDERFFYGVEDVELCLRARAHGFATVVAPDAQARHHLARTIGLASPDRLYYAARNQLLVAQLRFAPSRLRAGAIVAFNVAHALLTAKAPRAAGLAAVGAGVADHLRGRYGPRAGERARTGQ
jgi:GT2 family glycosyltransferase